MEILWSDRHLVLTVKEPGTPAQADPSGRPDMVQLLTQETGSPIYCVHRLDTGTGGVMVYAKTSAAAGAMSTLFGSGKTEKTYLAVVSGNPGDGRMEDLLWHDKRQNKSFVVQRARKGVKEAILEYHTVSTNSDGLSLVKIRLHTGRTHQIRIQFASRGMPLAGDRKYGSSLRCPMALWCSQLAFVHPVTGEDVHGFCLPPNEGIWAKFDCRYQQ